MHKVLSSLFITLLVLAGNQSYGWGKSGHRIVGYVAQEHLSRKAAKRVDKVLESYSLDMCGNFMDFIRSNDSFNYLRPWHYSTVPDGKTYEETEQDKRGDAVSKIIELTEMLKTKEFKHVPNEEHALMFLVHLVADLHQPLHVGNGKDKGGNDVKVQWFGEETNLHRVWDEHLVEFQNLSYTEFGNHLIRNTTKEQVKLWQSTGVLVWAAESQQLRDACYDFGENTNLWFKYNYRHVHTVEKRLNQAGVRLAKLLNEIYG